MYRLTDSFPYLLNRVGVRIGELFSKRLKPYDLTLPMYRVLVSLWETGDQRLNELGKATTLEVSSLSRLVGTMEERGLVVRNRLEDNARAVAINLTVEGRRLAEELIPQAVEFEEVAIHSFGRSEVARLKSAMLDIYEHLNALDPRLLEPGGKRKSGH
ncbi:MarR family winged helix-turn-helix transcriptional regulator [Pigmentiphaga kullae]|uniref:MarR family transcriptional regulator n=1 Tax=Pigmentiphaga kullae TaxID=151784 RepID=A0A4Q7NL99_9BURK|nr:MarR family transcriptional regulator [Pigmentiphaga kullae]RZS85706.1 MarR family transcriptional regulator [Pigmentiphaga kullae]